MPPCAFPRAALRGDSAEVVARAARPLLRAVRQCGARLRRCCSGASGMLSGMGRAWGGARDRTLRT
eukprot:2346132-Alexandrium_andersonii.AAC.1